MRRGANEVRDVQNIADILVDPEGALERRSHWEKTSHSLLVGAILHVLYIEEEKTLARVATWLDQELTSGKPTKLGGQFGAALRRALDLRRQWLITQGFADIDVGGMQYRPGIMIALERRDVARVGAQLSREIGLGFVETGQGERIEGTLRRQVKVGDGSFALVERSHEFTLVPWRPMLERQLGKQVEGMMRTTGDISWTVGRSRGLGIG